MKKIFFLLIAVLPVLAFVHADWMTLQLDERASVDFPGQWKKVQLAGTPGQQYDLAGQYRCAIVIFDLAAAGMDSADVASEMNLPGALEDFRNGIIEKMEGATLISEKKFLVSGKTAFDFAFNQKKMLEEDFDQMFNKNVFVGSKMYVLYFYQSKESPHDDIRTKFMESFRLK